MAHAPAPTAAAFDEMDPHGSHHHGQHASHVIVGPFILRTILAFLLFFTVLTVGLAQFEVWIEHALGIVLPWWVNVLVAMSIATVKSIMVMAYFMQLKYDNPINSVLMLFCFFALGLFLLFTGLDLFSRGSIVSYKSGPIVAGGTSRGIVGANNQPVVIAAKVRMKEQLAEDNIKEWIIAATTLQHAAHAAVDLNRVGQPAVDALVASAAILKHTNQMLDLHVVKLHPPTGPSQAAVAKDIAQIAEQLRVAGSPAAADMVRFAAQELATLDMVSAKAAYSVDSAFETLAAVAHGDSHEDVAIVSNGNRSRASTGLSGALGEPDAAHGQGEHGDDDAQSNKKRNVGTGKKAPVIAEQK